MRFIFTVLLLLSANILADEQAICRDDVAKSFISSWREGSEAHSVLTTILNGDTHIERGLVAYSDDINGDGNPDFIFESLDSQGSSRDRTYGIYIQCRGYLAFVGGDYFAGLGRVEDGQDGFKIIIFLSYVRDLMGEIVYADSQPSTQAHTWIFNSLSGRYEGDAD